MAYPFCHLKHRCLCFCGLHCVLNESIGNVKYCRSNTAYLHINPWLWNSTFFTLFFLSKTISAINLCFMAEQTRIFRFSCNYIFSREFCVSMCFKMLGVGLLKPWVILAINTVQSGETIKMNHNIYKEHIRRLDSIKRFLMRPIDPWRVPGDEVSPGGV